MTDAAFDTELPGNVQTTDLDTSESTIVVTSVINSLPLQSQIAVSADDDWIYNSEAGGTVDMPVAADEVLTLAVPFGQPLTFYAKAVGTANLYVLTERPCRCPGL